MAEQEQNDSRLSPEELYQRLIYELYENGPFRLVDEKGHPDLINDKTRLCCLRERFLDAITVLQKHDLVREFRNEQENRLYTLTYKGYLTALLARCKSKRDSRCKCNKCVNELVQAFEHLLKEMKRGGPMELVISNHRNHPHFVASESQLCCSQAPFLDAMCELEHYGLVSRSANFFYQLTSKGLISAQISQLPNSKERSERASAN